MGSTTVHEAHASSNKSFGHSRGRGRRQDKDFRRGGGRSDPNNQNSPRQQRNNLAMNSENDMQPTWKQNDLCNHYGLSEN